MNFGVSELVFDGLSGVFNVIMCFPPSSDDLAVVCSIVATSIVVVWVRNMTPAFCWFRD